MKKIIIMMLAVAMIAIVAVTSVSAAEGHYVWNHPGDGSYTDDPFNESTRVGHDSPLETTIRFKTDVSFSKIMFPKIWATAHAVVKIEMYSGETVVATKEFEMYNEEVGSGDVPNVEVDFGKALSAGEYTMVISVPEGFYAFFAYAADPLSDEYIEYGNGHALFGLYTTDEGQGFVTFATEVGGGSSSAPAASKAVLSLDAAKLGDLWDNNTGANTVDATKGDGFVTFTASGDDPFFAFAEPLNPGVDAKYAVVKYRTSGEGVGTLDFYLQIAEPHAQSDKLVTDGEWHYVVVDLSKPFPDNMDTIWDGTIARFDPMSGSVNGASIDIASIEFFTSEADALASTDASNPGTADASVIAIAAVACIALAGVAVAKKVR